MRKILIYVSFLALSTQTQIIVDECVLHFILSKNVWSDIMNLILVIDFGCSTMQIEYAHEQNHIWNVLLFLMVSNCSQKMSIHDCIILSTNNNSLSQFQIDDIYCNSRTQNVMIESFKPKPLQSNFVWFDFYFNKHCLYFIDNKILI